MLIDLTLKITPKMAAEAQGNSRVAIAGHLGTHFDVMDKEFPLAYTERKGIVFDVSHIKEREFEITDIDLSAVAEKMFVAFYTGYIEQVEYGTKEYFATHPCLSDALIEALLAKKVSIIGVDCAGIRCGKEHTPKDQLCADQGVFVVENLCNLKSLIGYDVLTICTYPMNYAEMSGLPCRVIAKVKR